MVSEPLSCSITSDNDFGNQFSDAARVIWAKYDPNSNEWMSLWRHMADSAAMADMIWKSWLPRGVRRLVSDSLPGGESDARRLLSWLSSIHDIGKATPSFACQVDWLAGRMQGFGLEVARREEMDRHGSTPHALAGQFLVQEWVTEKYGWSNRSAMQLGAIIGGHHGAFPSFAQINDLDSDSFSIRAHGASGERWRQVQSEFLVKFADVCGVSDRLSEWRSVRLAQPVQVVLAALVTLVDWIVSTQDCFPYDNGLELTVSTADRVTAAWRALDLPEPWVPVEPRGTAAEVFATRVAPSADENMDPLWEEAICLARESSQPGLVILEAPVGEGKTNAALVATEIAAARSGAGGLFIAMPTLSAALGMESRLRAWLSRLPRRDHKTSRQFHTESGVGQEGEEFPVDWIPTIVGLDADGDPGASSSVIGAPSLSEELAAHRWLRGPKRELLAPFVVGTIDQLLGAAVESRHAALRHLALASKVVLIEDPGSCGAPTDAFLERTLTWLAGYRVPVIISSTALSAPRRRALAEAYAGASPDTEQLGRVEGYPLLTSIAPGNRLTTRLPVQSASPAAPIRLEQLDEDEGQLADRLAGEVAEGRLVLVVRNSVDRVLHTAEHLRERFGTAHVTVAHSRLVADDWERKRSEIGDLLRDRRGTGHIIVASPVIEHFDDFDVDVLVTDLAPAKPLLERIGRLRRHSTESRRNSAPPRRCVITGVHWQALPPEPVQQACHVYDRYVLLRSLAALEPYLDASAVDVTEFTFNLVRNAHKDPHECPAAWAPALAHAQEEYQSRSAEERATAERWLMKDIGRPGRSLVGWTEPDVGDIADTPAGRALVRGEPAPVEVLVVQQSHGGTLTTLPWLGKGRGGLAVPRGGLPEPPVARVVAASRLRLPHFFSQEGIREQAIQELAGMTPPAWQVDHSLWLAGKLVLVLDSEGRARLAGYDLQYTPGDGLMVVPAASPDLRLVGESASFDLTSRPWIPVQRSDGSIADLSLRQIFAEAGAVRRVVGDVATQEFALVRLLLAIAHDAVRPANLDEWEDLWTDNDPFAVVAEYLDRHRERFDLLHPRTPFFQTADLRTAKDEVASLNRIVADVPVGRSLFTTRAFGAQRLTFAEAARWLVHAHAFDPSGIKSGAVGDPRVKNNKGYPQGVAWAGHLGGVFVEGATLRETLLLNLIPGDAARPVTACDSQPAWCHSPTGPAPLSEEERAFRPRGPQDMYTWQSRRVRLHFDHEGVHGVVLCYGDPLSPVNQHQHEPMTAWTRSPAQERRLHTSPVYMPRAHDSDPFAWRSLSTLLRDATPPSNSAADGDKPQSLRPAVVDWVAQVITEGVIAPRHLLRLRTIGVRYGTQQSVISELIDDSVPLPGLLLHEQDLRYAEAALGAVSDNESVVTALGDLAADLATVAGRPPGRSREDARWQGFHALDAEFRNWLHDLASSRDPAQERRAWQQQAHRTITDLAQRWVAHAGSAAWQGTIDRVSDSVHLVDAATAEQRFRARVNQALSGRFAIDSSSEGETADGHAARGQGAAAARPSSAWASTTHEDAMQATVRDTTSMRIDLLQRGYRRSRPEAQTVVARLRKATGTPLDSLLPDLREGMDLGWVDVPAFTEDQKAWVDNAVHLVMTLWAVHQQARQQANMHVVNGPTLGGATARLMRNSAADEPAFRRFSLTTRASSLTVLRRRLLDLVLWLRQELIPLDYGLLAAQVYRWQQPGGQSQVQHEWVRGFHARQRRSPFQPSTRSNTSHAKDLM
ncbi:type I-E CRISPR-associated protein Cse1/CasA [Nocardiopsis suaedae]|uniref:Type I-E CRISPR-associated protein Cse1/CasA n=1 Tax=Nocardiopsis suaedae TaxID=3018444 RepID=A0ABT4TR42_9ACTN|nr:type I-E CRISPR-associated protein Cse1/CasA [Nocardiopsis suaedae]MDA2807142.1 type I-E CRISPR-associated protein Cse1/CasA [Nocardiopsis suaedae]